MARAAVRGRLSWQEAEVLAVHAESATSRRILLRPVEWPGHRAGQHVDVRLTADDGYTARRSYSIASGPEDPEVALVVDRLDDGEVSTYLTEGLSPGDRLELRGPIGGFFVWPEATAEPVQLVAGGSGVVPFLAMLRHHRAADSSVRVRLLYSVRGPGDVIGRDELATPAESVRVDLTYTRTAPAGWTGPTGRVDAALLESCAFGAAERPHVFVCGGTPFVEAVSRALVDLGHDAARIRTERYGGTGGD